MIKIEKIVAGGQTGTDRAALDFAIERGIAHGGWCPKGRRAIDGSIPDKYNLQETVSSDYPERTDLNVRDSDATVIFTLEELSKSRGSKLTTDCAEKHKKPWLHLIPSQDAGSQLREFLGFGTGRSKVFFSLFLLARTEWWDPSSWKSCWTLS